LQAQNLLPNGSFQAGQTQPEHWRLEGAGQWGGTAANRWLVVQGKGEDSSQWISDNVALTPGGLYRFAFQARREPGTSGGSIVSGPARVNRDFGASDDWQRHEFVFRVPDDQVPSGIRLGQWHASGQFVLDDAELVPVLAWHRQGPGGLALGEGESIRGGVYRFQANLDWRGANYHRTLVTNRAGFNSNRWLFSPGAEVVYEHRLPGTMMTSARLHASVGHYESGAVRLEASRDGAAWTTVTELNEQQRSGWFPLATNLLPADRLLIRLVTSGAEGNLQINSYDFEASLQAPPADLEGETQFLEVLQQSSRLAVGLGDFQAIGSHGRCSATFTLTNRTAAPLPVKLRLSADAVGTKRAAGEAAELSLKVAPSAVATVTVTGPVLTPETRLVRVEMTDAAQQPLFSGSLPTHISFLEDNRFGYRLDAPAELNLWWCESGWKVGRNRAAPVRTGDHLEAAVTLSAARGEFEAAQVVFRPEKDVVLLAARAMDFKPKASIEVQLAEVAYVNITQPTDSSCVAGAYPDPLPPLRPPLMLRAGRNQPLWVTVRVPAEAAAGDYTGKLELETSLGVVRVPLAVHVYGFTMPRDTHLRSALGLGSGEPNRYHHLTKPEDQLAVYEKYLRNFAEHRISPYSFYDFAPIQVRFVGEGPARHAEVDFSKFDLAAAKWLDEARFSTFQLPLQGMGGGTFQSRSLGELDGHKEGTPEHARLFQDYLSQVERHLHDRGWLGKAFTYWFDEPDPKDYEFVVAGMKRLKAAAPGIARLLTEQPEKELIGNVEIWCGLTPEWTRERVQERRRAGEQVWWYICTGPKAPYVTEFIDHPGTELRLWPWQSWQYGVSGILVWATVYWNSPLVYVAPKIQDPWTDPMSWVSGYDFPVGHVSPWGNGDGRFLYPPRRDPVASTTPNLDDPINSTRWENLRDGMEDYEYLWLLQEAVKQAEAAGKSSRWVTEARKLLEVPPEVSKDLTHFTTDPRPILAHRDRVARMIERLSREK